MGIFWGDFSREGRLIPSRKSQQRTKKTALTTHDDSISGAPSFFKMVRRANGALQREYSNDKMGKIGGFRYADRAIGGG